MRRKQPAPPDGASRRAEAARRVEAPAESRPDEIAEVERTDSASARQAAPARMDSAGQPRALRDAASEQSLPETSPASRRSAWRPGATRRAERIPQESSSGGRTSRTSPGARRTCLALSFRARTSRTETRPVRGVPTFRESGRPRGMWDSAPSSRRASPEPGRPRRSACSETRSREIPGDATVGEYGDYRIAAARLYE